jgi:hypothetical protein
MKGHPKLVLYKVGIAILLSQYRQIAGAGSHQKTAEQLFFATFWVLFGGAQVHNAAHNQKGPDMISAKHVEY